MTYRNCKWCHGRGCLYCEGEADKDYAAAFPNGPQPIATFDNTTAEGVAAAVKCLGVDALNKAFGPNGHGVWEIVNNCEKHTNQHQPKDTL